MVLPLTLMVGQVLFSLVEVAPGMVSYEMVLPLTLMVGQVLFSLVEVVPGMLSY
jgi:hypothetical protein